MLGGLLRDIAILLLLGVGVVLLFHRLRIPALVGFLIAGVIAGPHGLGLIGHAEEVETLAEVGVVILMFTIGLEFSLDGLGQVRRLLVTSGGLQVLLTIAVVGTGAAAASAAGIGGLSPLSRRQALFLGMLVALSSTAIVLKVIGDRGELDSPHGRTAIAILIFQDLCVVPMMLLAPLLAGDGVAGIRILVVALQVLFVPLLTVVLSRRIVPRLLDMAAGTRSHEVFVLTVILICIGTAALSDRIGLSLALGAFIAGVVISDSEYSHQALSDILPFRDALASLFFLSVGMLLDLRAVLHSPGLVVGGVVLAMGVKAVLAAAAVFATGYSLRVATAAGLSLAQIGEFSFVLAQVGRDLGLLPVALRQPVLAGTVLSMVATPFLVAGGVRLGSRVAELPEGVKMKGLPGALGTPPKGLRDHTIIIGFGLNGRNLARVLGDAHIPYVAVDMDPRIVAAARRNDLPVVFGDACHARVLEQLGVESARVVVIAISDAASSRRAVELVRRLNPKADIIVRTRYMQEVELLSELGATEIVPEEFEISIEIFSRVLRIYHIPRDKVDAQIRAVREDGYVMLRYRELSGVSLVGTMAGLRTEILRIEEGSVLAGKTLAESQLRARTGAAVVAVKRGDEAMTNPDPDIIMQAGDVVLLLGTEEQIAAGAELFQAAVAGSESTAE